MRNKILIASVSVILLGLAVFWVKLFIDAPLYIDIQPSGVTRDVTTGQEMAFDFRSEVSNFPTCKALCNTSLIDLTEGRYLFKEELAGNSFYRRLNITMPERGEGIRNYRYQISCRNLDTLFCPGSHESLRSSFLSFRYTVSDESKRLKTLKKLNATIQNLVSADIIRMQNNQIAASLASKYENFNWTLKSQGFREILLKTESQVSLWKQKEYGFDPPLGQSIVLLKDLREEQEKLIGLKERYEHIVDFTELLKSSIISLNRAYSFYQSLSELNPSKDNLVAFYEVRKTLERLRSFTLQDIRSTFNTAIELKEDINETLETYNKDLDDLAYGLNVVLWNHSLKLQDPKVTALDVNYDFNSLCRKFNRTLDHLREHNSNVTWNSTTLAYREQRQEMVYSLINDRNISFDYSEQINDQAFINITGSYYRSRDIACGLDFTRGRLDNIDLNLSHLDLKLIDESNISLSVEMPEPRCCFYRNCSSCCTKDCSSDDYPIIFLHGHLFNKDLPPSASLQSLAPLCSL